MTASTSKFTDRVLQNIKEAIKNDTIAYKYLDKSLKNDPDILKLIK